MACTPKVWTTDIACRHLPDLPEQPGQLGAWAAWADLANVGRQCQFLGTYHKLSFFSPLLQQ